MPLAPGTKLRPYQVIALLGAGGEVYRTRDGRLQPDVAIKVLPESLSVFAPKGLGSGSCCSL